MANITLKLTGHSDLYPPGTVVKAYPATARHFAAPPGGPSLAEATVTAAGLLEITVPAKRALVLYALVENTNRYLRIGDPASDAPLLGLRARVKRARVVSGALA